MRKIVWSTVILLAMLSDLKRSVLSILSTTVTFFSTAS